MKRIRTMVAVGFATLVVAASVVAQTANAQSEPIKTEEPEQSHRAQVWLDDAIIRQDLLRQYRL